MFIFTCVSNIKQVCNIFLMRLFSLANVFKVYWFCNKRQNPPSGFLTQVVAVWPRLAENESSFCLCLQRASLQGDFPSIYVSIMTLFARHVDAIGEYSKDSNPAWVGFDLVRAFLWLTVLYCSPDSLSSTASMLIFWRFSQGPRLCPQGTVPEI